MKTAVVSILILLLSIQTFSKWLIVIEFNLNKEFIAASLCENKAKPQLKCNGKCQLVKNLNEGEKESKPSLSLKLNFTDTYFADESINMTARIISLQNSFYSFHQTINIQRYNPSVFHPPC